MIKYTLFKQNRNFLPSAGQYVARAVHTQVVDTEEIAGMIQENCTLKRSDVLAVLSELEDVMVRLLQRGDIVKLNHLGRLKLEIEGSPVANVEEFNPNKHIRGVRLHLIPESKNGCQRLYDGIRFEEWQP
ncbi:DNA-binding protein [Prevotella sp. E9-3]|uniref:HU family DNA-binding protein n=1 Tax=Prevotella sp. E9-3 TaxID=2913621 RepID=UPI001EDAC893|nr:DNA-binding domain-containing protein [Prevotella sp. E9-3]UKK48020.1 DNA-binding protein [Prevotella sp. E9-3]